MAKLGRSAALALFVAMLVAPCANAEQERKPLTKAKLLALVAGNALAENVIDEIAFDGLAFHPDQMYRKLLKTAGADTKIIAALASAKVTAEAAKETASDNEVVGHIASAASLMNAKRYDDAAEELAAALVVGFKSPESGFVMGEVLRRKEEWDKAAIVYQAVLSQDPDFPEARTKLSYVFYRGGDDESALREARAELARTPGNAEAHKNAGLALMDQHNFDAAQQEYKEALRLKPDYLAVQMEAAKLEDRMESIRAASMKPN